jgi:hypothetical protein
MSERSFVPSVAPELVLTIDGADRTLRPASYRVDRDPEADIVVSDSRVSWNHAVLRAVDEAWFVEAGLAALFTLAAWWRLIQISPGRTRRR